MQKKPYRPFQISCGLMEGYDAETATSHTIEEASVIIQNWIRDRVVSNKKVVAGTLIEGQFIYPINKNQNLSAQIEPSFHYKGIVREDTSDEEALELLEDLVKNLSQKLNQKRIHIQFCSDYFLFEKE